MNTSEWISFANQGNKLSKQSEYQDLLKVIAYHDNLYDNEQPEITDTDYDKLYFLVDQFEKAHPELKTESAANQITGQLKGDLPEIKHTHPMLSLAKANNIESVEEFLGKWSNSSKTLYYTNGFIVQHKEDGLTTVLYFNEPSVNHGQFTAATRGDGVEGEDVTAAFKHVLGAALLGKIEAKLNDKTLVVRGESIIDDADFEAINTDGEYMNSRNLVSGSVRTKDTTIAKQRKVHILLYNVENNLDFNLDTETEQLSFLTTLFGKELISHPLIVDNKTVLNKAEVVKVIDGFTTDDREKIGHTIDGLVIKPNVISNREKIGYTSHHPKNALAYKFASPDAITKLTDVIWQTGASGQVTPVGIFNPINLLGATITKASLANFNNIQKRDIRIGDTILVQRSNDVIPQIIKSFPKKRKGSEIVITQPAHTHVDGGLLFSDNVNGRDQLIQKWRLFASKNGLDIDGLSISTIEKLANNNLIDLTDFSSVFKIEHDKFIEIDGLGELKWKQLQTSLAKAKLVGPAHVLVSLNIPVLGNVLSKAIVDYEPDINKLIDIYHNNTQNDWVDQFITQTAGVGPSTKTMLLTKFFNQDTISQLENLAAEGVQLVNQQKTLTSLAGLTFVVTGKTDFPRRELKEKIEVHGGKLTNSVSKNTDYLVCDSSNANSSKYKKATSLNVPIISEAKLLKMM